QADSHQLPLYTTPTDVTQIAAEVIDNFSLAAEEQAIALRLDTEGTIPIVTVDAVRVRQMLTSLVDNALRYTPSGGQITVRLANPPDRLLIVVADPGQGIPANQLSHIFDRFYRVDPSRFRSNGGSGLGLAIVKALVEIQRGTIEVQSEGLDRGTTFTLT